MLRLSVLVVLLLRAEEEVPRAVKDKAVAATVKVVNVAEERQGSGVIIRRHGPHVYVLTANHVVAKAKKLELHVRREKGEPKVYRSATVLAGSPQADLAIIRLASSDDFPVALPVCEKGKGPRARSFQAISAGWPKVEATAQEEKVKQKVLLRRPGEKESVWSYETERKPTHGRSGGPLVDAAGRVLGVASGHDAAAGYFTHFDEIHRFLRQNGLQWLFDKDE
jgi:hypothetical protein